MPTPTATLSPGVHIEIGSEDEVQAARRERQYDNLRHRHHHEPGVTAVPGIEVGVHCPVAVVVLPQTPVDDLRYASAMRGRRMS